MCNKHVGCYSSNIHFIREPAEIVRVSFNLLIDSIHLFITQLQVESSVLNRRLLNDPCVK